MTAREAVSQTLNAGIKNGQDPEYLSRAAALEQGAADSLGGKIADWFGAGNSARAQATRNAADRAYEQQANNSARAWDEYMQSTYYQRATKDLEAAGLNPWIILNSGLSSSNYSTAGSGSSARNSYSKSKGSAGTVIAAFMVAAAKIIAAVI